MKNGELKSYIDREIAQAMGGSSNTGDLSKARQNAMKAYLGEKMGNEVEGRSKYIDRALLETVEWMLPSLLKIFFGSGDAVSFQPENQEDEEQAKQETDVINYTLTKKNNIFKVFYTWFKDALLQKNGVVKYYWKEDKEIKEYVYTGLTLEQVMMLEQDEDLEVVEQDVKTEEMDGGQIVELYDVKVKETKKKGEVRLDPVAPENFLVHPETGVDIQESKFVAEQVILTRSELVKMGYDRKRVDKLSASVADINDNLEKTERNNLSDERVNGGVDTAGRAMDEIKVYEVYMNVDFDGDGIAERRRIFYVEGSDDILENEPFDYIPYASITPTILTHKYFGLSEHDIMGDLQVLKTMLIRNIVDNIYFVNNQRLEVDVNGIETMKDVLDNRPGSIIRSRKMGSVREIQTSPLGGDVYKFIESIDGTRENRTGVTRYNQGLDANSLNKTASGISQIMTASQQRLELVARVFAETGVKELALGVHRLLRENQKIETAVRLNNGWVDVNPESWKERFDMTVEVGLGTGNKEQMAAQYTNLFDIQLKAMQMQTGIVESKGLYATAIKIAENAGITVPEKHFTDPTQQQDGQDGQPQVDPAQAQAQAQQQALQAEQQQAIAKLQAELQLKQAEVSGNLQIKKEQAAGDMAIKKQKMEGELRLKDAQAMSTEELNRFKELGGYRG